MTTFSDGQILDAADINSITQGTGIEDGAIGAAKIAAEAWTAFTPTWNNVTLGTGETNAGRYIVIGKTVHLTALLTLGTGGSVTGTLSMTLPASQTTANQTVTYQGAARALDSGTANWIFTARLDANDTTIGFVTNNNSSVVNATTPFTWAAGDSLSFTITYELA